MMFFSAMDRVLATWSFKTSSYKYAVVGDMVVNQWQRGELDLNHGRDEARDVR